MSKGHAYHISRQDLYEAREPSFNECAVCSTGLTLENRRHMERPTGYDGEMQDWFFCPSCYRRQGSPIHEEEHGGYLQYENDSGLPSHGWKRDMALKREDK